MERKCRERKRIRATAYVVSIIHNNVLSVYINTNIHIDSIHAGQREIEKYNEFKRKERERELKENWDMKIAEEERLTYLSKSRTTNVQVYMRQLGTIEAIYDTKKKQSNIHVQSRAAQNMRELDLHIISCNLNQEYEEDIYDDDDLEADSSDENKILKLKNKSDPLDDGIEEDLTYIEDGWQYTLSHELVRYPDANTIKCTKFGVVGAKLLSKELAPPLPQGYNESKSLQTSTEAITLSDLNLGPGACPVSDTISIFF